MQGDLQPYPIPLCAHLVAGRKRSIDRVELLRATIRREGQTLWAVPDDNQASGAATSLAKSDGLAIVPPGETPIAAGAPIDFVRWADA
jgi:molybdopterin biosynthesis enzyme